MSSSILPAGGTDSTSWFLSRRESFRFGARLFDIMRFMSWLILFLGNLNKRCDRHRSSLGLASYGHLPLPSEIAVAELVASIKYASRVQPHYHCQLISTMSNLTAGRGSSISQHLRATKKTLQDVALDATYALGPKIGGVGGLTFRFAGPR